MANAKLHIICGNCGCNDNFEYRHVEHFTGPDDQAKQMVTELACQNCSTLHVLNNNAKNRNPVHRITPIGVNGYHADCTNLSGDLTFANVEQRNKALALMVKNQLLRINEHGEYWWTNRNGDDLGLAIVNDELELEIPDTLYAGFDSIQAQVLDLSAGGNFTRVSTEDVDTLGVAQFDTEKSVFAWLDGKTLFTNKGSELITLCLEACPDTDIDKVSAALCECQDDFEHEYPEDSYSETLWSALDSARDGAIQRLKADS